MMTVAMVCVPGGEYDRSHVERLAEQVEKHLTLPHDFSLITVSDKPGFWAKIDLFQPGWCKNRTLYLDLDVTIVGSLDEIVEFPHQFASIKDYQYPLLMNSSVMVWDAGAGDAIYNNFRPAVMEKFHGDQGWISHTMPGAARFPPAWCVSYRQSVQSTGIVPDDARVVVWHGQPKPWTLEELTCPTS